MAEEQETDVVDADQIDDAEEPEGQDALGDAGKKALDTMKAQRATARKERDAAKAEAAAAKAELAKLKGDKPAEPDVEAITAAAKAEAAAAVLRDRVLDRIEAKAAKTFTDPEDARALLASRADEFIDDGTIDTDAIVEALAETLKKKPHLAAQGKRFEGSADGGARKGSGVTQVTESELKKMSPDEIVKARREGRLADLM